MDSILIIGTQCVSAAEHFISRPFFFLLTKIPFLNKVLHSLCGRIQPEFPPIEIDLKDILEDLHNCVIHCGFRFPPTAHQKKPPKNFKEQCHIPEEKGSTIKDQDLIFRKISQSADVCPTLRSNTFSITEMITLNKTYPCGKPTDNLILHRIEHYKTKYDIYLEIVDYPKANIFVQKLQELKTAKKTGGIIYIPHHPEQPSKGHVVPLLFNFENENNELVLLDVIQRHIFIQNKCINKTFKEMNRNGTTCICFQNPRQADIFSCRTDAPVILRNSLLYLKRQKELHGKACSFMGDSPYEERGYRIYQHLPPSCDYTSQISNKNPKANEAIISRDLYSKHPSKRTNPRNVGEFRWQHTHPSIYSNTLAINRFNQEQSQEQPELQKGVNTNLSFTPDSIKWEEQRNENTYMLYKHAKNVLDKDAQ